MVGEPARPSRRRLPTAQGARRVGRARQRPAARSSWPPAWPPSRPRSTHAPHASAATATRLPAAGAEDPLRDLTRLGASHALLALSVAGANMSAGDCFRPKARRLPTPFPTPRSAQRPKTPINTGDSSRVRRTRTVSGGFLSDEGSNPSPSVFSVDCTHLQAVRD